MNRRWQLPDFTIPAAREEASDDEWFSPYGSGTSVAGSCRDDAQSDGGEVTAAPAPEPCSPAAPPSDARTPPPLDKPTSAPPFGRRASDGGCGSFRGLARRLSSYAPAPQPTDPPRGSSAQDLRCRPQSPSTEEVVRLETNQTTNTDSWMTLLQSAFTGPTPLERRSRQRRRRWSRAACAAPDDADSEPSEFCRICREGGRREPLITPCDCRGTVRFVHKSCLERWLAESDTSYCEICGLRYHTLRMPRYGLLKTVLLWAVSARHDLFVDLLTLLTFLPLAVLGTSMGMTASRSLCYGVLTNPDEEGLSNIVLMVEPRMAPIIAQLATVGAQTMSAAVVAVMAALDIAVSAWLVLRVQQHAARCYSWWRRHCVVRLIHPPPPNALALPLPAPAPPPALAVLAHAPALDADDPAATRTILPARQLLNQRPEDGFPEFPCSEASPEFFISEELEVAESVAMEAAEAEAEAPGQPQCVLLTRSQSIVLTVSRSRRRRESK